MAPTHLPVMVESVVELLSPSAGGKIIDATLGMGGHAHAILRKLGSEGCLVGLDRDPQMLQLARERLAPFGKAAQLVHARLFELLEICRARGFEGVDGVLMDLGLCSAQLDERERGFSFDPGSDARPLDMRMDRSRGETAAELLARLGEKELAAVLHAGDVPAPVRTARALLAHLPLRTTRDLLDAVATLPRPRRRHHPATLIFQALRLAVNEELTDLECALEGALELLAPGGRLVVLSYHSGEDRRVKAFLKREEHGCICPPDLPRCGCG